MELWRRSRKWKMNGRLFQQTNTKKKTKKKTTKMNTARECGFLTCDMLILKRFMKIVVPLETNQFKEHCKDFKNWNIPEVFSFYFFRVQSCRFMYAFELNCLIQDSQIMSLLKVWERSRIILTVFLCFVFWFEYSCLYIMSCWAFIASSNVISHLEFY